MSRLTKADIKKFRARLEELRAEMLKQLEGVTSDVQSPDEASGYSQHQADQGTDDFDRTISIELSSNDRGILKQIDRALEKIDEDTYGLCDITEKPIPKARLDAIPYATMTVEAQEKMEQGLL